MSFFYRRLNIPKSAPPVGKSKEFLIIAVLLPLATLFLDANRCHLHHPKFASCSILTRSQAKCWPVRAYFAPAERDFIRSVGSLRDGHSLPNEPAELWRRC